MTRKTGATISMDSWRWVRHGLARPGMTCEEWDARFAALGGRRCRIGFAWAPAGTVTLYVSGSPEALAFVRDSLAQEYLMTESAQHTPNKGHDDA